MSIFDKVIEADKAVVVDLNVRYQHLLQYAKLLGVDEIDPLILRSGIGDGVTNEALTDLQILIESAADQAVHRSEKAEKEPFVIDNKDKLDWYLKIAGGLDHEIRGIESQAKILKNQLKSFNELFEKQAEDFGLADYKRTGVKTTILAHGTVRVRTQKNDSYSVEDEDELQEWLGNLSVEDRATFKVFAKTYTRDLDVIKANAAKGLPVPGLHKEEAGDKISLSFPKAGGE